MIKNITAIEIEKNDRKYVLMLDPLSPLGEVHDVLSEMKSLVINKMVEIEKKPAQEEQSIEA